MSTENQKFNRFEILSHLAIDGAQGKDIKEIADMALAWASDYVGLTAASLYLWDDKSEVTMSVEFSNSDSSRKYLNELEEDLFRKLRKEVSLSSAYMSFDGDPEYHSFTLPLKYGNKKFGAIIGLQEGKRTLLIEELFLESMTAIIGLSYAIQVVDAKADTHKSEINRERTQAIIETAITINHEINNPLTAILGNIQLLLMDEDKLSKELKGKLEIVEESALKIKDVVQKLLKLTSPRSVEYANGTNMIDLNGDEDSDK